MTQFDVDPAQLHGHAAGVGDVADQLSAIGGQLPSGLADLALGPFTQFLTSGLQGAMTHVANTITNASSSVAEMSTGISRTAARYQNVDTSNATNLNRESPR
jgi:uncharacterized protein YukE